MTQGKGSTRRPQQVSDEVMAENWERAFGERDLFALPEGNQPLPLNQWKRTYNETIESCIVKHTFQLKGPPRATIRIVLDESLPDDTLIMKRKP